MSTLAKLTAPNLEGAYLRQRLFARLDELSVSPAIWVAGPPGAGKTTLIASYLRTRKRARIWYQVDLTDNDPASFFHYLREAAPRSKNRCRC